MGAAKNNPTTITTFGRGRFAPDQVRVWEADQCAAFAVAIERLRGWPVHATFIGDEVVRLQAENASDQVYDPRGIFAAERFGTAVLIPLTQTRRDWPPSAFQGTRLRLGTQCVGAEGLADLGVIVDETRIEAATVQIEANTAYAELVPTRPHPWLPAKTLTRYSWSGCVAYAEALSRITGLPAMTMTPVQVAQGHDISGKRIHAVVQHPDGTVEDVWGRQSAEAVARRYAMVRWALDAQAHRAMMEEAYCVRPAAADDVAEAEALIRQYRIPAPAAKRS
ncbi:MULTISPECIES: hypothetical protein [Methylobacterium]|uniref:hypothetical protein n=1 Tax=Methylobacterium TaxID=407 RepID=UPI0013EBDC2A|nr:hypothetical protein [Methylobacterium sp. DB0501]NGM38271.1 hypothetical protein [Methylobacterium sp. DB0501]